MSFRTLFRVTATALAIVTGGTAISLAAAAVSLSRAAARLSATVETVRAAEGLELALLVHNRSVHLKALTGDPKYGSDAAAAATRLRNWLRLARIHSQTSREREQLADVDRKLDDYLDTRGQPAIGPVAIERYEQLLGAPDAALASIEKLVDLNLAEAQVMEERSAGWDRLATVVGVVMAALLAAIVTIALVGLGRGLFQPLAELRSAIARFGAGDRLSRAGEGGASELREVARSFNEMSAALTRQNENQLAFLAGVAHDLRNSLNGLKIAAGVFRPDRELPSEGRLRRLLELVNRQVERVDRMADDLLDRTRIEAGQLDLNLELRDLREVVAEACDLYREATRNHRLERNIPGAAVAVDCDAQRIMQVLDNLLSNAIKYSPGGGTVAVALCADGYVATISVSDQGLGMSSDEVAHLFEPFRRGAVSGKAAPGIGLGLSVANRIVEAHRGRITVETAPGAGATFRVLLPLAAGVVADPPAAGAAGRVEPIGSAPSSNGAS